MGAVAVLFFMAAVPFVVWLYSKPRRDASKETVAEYWHRITHDGE